MRLLIGLLIQMLSDLHLLMLKHFGLRLLMRLRLHLLKHFGLLLLSLMLIGLH